MSRFSSIIWKKLLQADLIYRKGKKKILKNAPVHFRYRGTYRDTFKIIKWKSGIYKQRFQSQYFYSCIPYGRLSRMRNLHRKASNVTLNGLGTTGEPCRTNTNWGKPNTWGSLTKHLTVFSGTLLLMLSKLLPVLGLFLTIWICVTTNSLNSQE